MTEERYTAAVAYVGGQKGLSNDQRLQAYGLFKQATVGDVNTGRPGFFDPVGGAKWDAWDKLKGKPSAEAKLGYIALAESVGFAAGDAARGAPGGGDCGARVGDGGGGGGGGGGGLMGPVQSTMEEVEGEGARGFVGGEEIFKAASEGDAALLGELIGDAVATAGGGSAAAAAIVNARDDSGLSALHRACDRGHAGVVRLLLSFPGVEVGAVGGDEDALTPLHYAVLCENAEVAQLLLCAGADPSAADGSGESAFDAADSEAMRALLSQGKALP